MKRFLKILAAILLSGLTLQAFSGDTIYKTTEGTVMKCTHKMTEGNIQEFNRGTPYYYTFRDGKLYSRSFFEMFAPSWRQNYKKNTPRALRLKVTDEKVSFSEYCSVDTGALSLKTKIDRSNGQLTFKAERYYHWSGKTMYRKTAKGTGRCVIVK